MTQRSNDPKAGPPSAVPPVIGGSYLAGELARTLRAAAAHTEPSLRERAEARARRLLAALEQLVSGKARVGDRQPLEGNPTWITPEVVRGGFASGEDASGGEWLAHERDLAARLHLPADGARTALNGHHLTREGYPTLADQLASRRYRVDLPEESALLAIGWLLAQGEHAVAASLIEQIEPFFDRLRFYPRPASTPIPDPVVGLEAPVLARSAHSLAEGFSHKRPSKSVETMREHHEVWAPLTDELVTLVLDTVAGAPPRFEGDGAGRAVTGGVPFTRLPDDFESRRGALLAKVAAARAGHARCQRIHRENEVLGCLVAALAAWPGLDAERRDRSAQRVRHRLAGFVTAHGVPGSEAHRALRASQVTGPSHARIAQLLAARLIGQIPPGEGLSPEDIVAASRPITPEEQVAAVPAGTPVPPRFTARLSAAQEAPVSALLERRLVKSGEALAALLPQLTGPALATRFTDPAARALHAASYRAFRRRRSLLLLWLQHQVRFTELPWIAALEACADADPRPAAEDTLRQFAACAITAFPATITPNKLVSELATLAGIAQPPQDPAADGSGQPKRPRLPLVEELAADIFMGTFSVKYLRAAQVAMRFLQDLPGGGVYTRYYGLDAGRLASMHRLQDKWGVTTCPDFDAYCLALAALPEGGNPRARNGAVIEQAAILTTHNLAVLVDVLRLQPMLEGHWASLAERAFTATLDRLERRVIPESIPVIQRKRASKTLAFSWRQMIFFVARMAPAAQGSFVGTCHRLLATRSPVARERFAPVLAGLKRVVAGGTLPPEASHREVDGCRRLLGWTVDTPFLMGEAPAGPVSSR
ncbi:hypothetical protein [Mitsuaria sp. GD03876]|uniref:hypothetical protein n=1 Tax=Mitsuaria sp. GD03876 TaxID=2975399 RepID=UPI00244C3A4C|nr:hypothetical protein [Mitsuaria sp. GD03876]MDH0863356.1 hypothetical protein [Mitsuaria sp. GD03876]